MKVVPQAFYQASQVKKVMRDGLCSVIHKYASQADLDNHRLLSAHALTVVRKGGLMVHNDEGLPTHVSNGQMVLLPKGLYAITDLIPEEDVFEAMVYFFDDELIHSFLQQKGLAQTEVICEPKPVKFSVNESLSQFNEQLLSLYANLETDAAIVRLKLLEALHLIDAKDQNGSFVEKVQELTAKPRKRLEQFMNNHYDKPLDVEAFAQLSGRSIATFRRDFHRLFGKAPKQWLIDKRLTKAQELLSTNEYSVSRVAQLSGYTDLPHFIKSFQKQFNISPKQFALSQRI